MYVSFMCEDVGTYVCIVQNCVVPLVFRLPSVEISFSTLHPPATAAFLLTL